MAFTRYAVFYVPPAQSELAAFGREWLGMDIETGSAVAQMDLNGFSKSKINSITATARNYGFHGTVPPFLWTVKGLQTPIVLGRSFHN